MPVNHRATGVADRDSRPCRFCGRPFLEHTDPPTQLIDETDCLGSRCNFKPVVTDHDRESLRAACRAALAWVENKEDVAPHVALANQLRAALGMPEVVGW